MKKAFVLLIITLSCVGIFSQSSKKVYADYHGTRYTREHDGMVGRWSYYANTDKSNTPIKRLCYNADVILENGRNDIAAVAYPQVGIQSALDPEFIEYEILTAKAAGIDGFFIEWGYPEHESDLLLRAMQNVANKYDFEIGVNWCDGWLYYDWITEQNPKIKTREDKTAHFVKSFQYLIDNVFSVSTAPIVKGRPVVYLFGGGITDQEYANAVDPGKFKIPKKSSFPLILRRIAEWGKLEDNKYVPVPFNDEIDKWTSLGMVPSPWIPARVRPMDEKYPLWDQYGTCEDAVAFLQPFKEDVWDNSKYPIKSGFVAPGMDNRGCAGWGRSHFFLIPRNKGETYEKLWEVNMANKDNLDMIFIASWSDYTEGHEIEPTIENGDRELRTTLKYASQFKNVSLNPLGIDLPKKLFELRKKVVFLKNCGQYIPQIEASLDKIAKALSDGKYEESIKMLAEQEAKIAQQESKLKKETYDSPDLYFVRGKDAKEGMSVQEKVLVFLDNSLKEKLKKNNFEGYITFEYLDEGTGGFKIYTTTDREPKSLFSVVADVRFNKTNEWKKARIKLYKSNIAFKASPDFTFSGKGEVRNIALAFDIYFQPILSP